ncbi:hypothetical protein HNR60_003478 [Rhodopseudomonas rhenobacensis]|uniref:Uncharacterized protein n=1 Tax=Rhodopseudomonas rhenobacensis TaxID=87461 RepID=A0A7W8E0B1_9BRAD|nr:hypothetical protein [Rhodopseudomonas rhenobacensis]MBB5048710.1 hypothetical protein [Rhodopseudomonas rhenobacensis]
MAENTPNDPYRRDPIETERATRLDQELRGTGEPMRSGMSTGKIAAFAAAVVLLVGALYYGMNVSSTNPSTASNSGAGTTTGSSTAPATPPAPAASPSNSTTSPAR